MIARLIHWSIGNRFLVLLATVMLTAWGVVSMLQWISRAIMASLLVRTVQRARSG